MTSEEGAAGGPGTIMSLSTTVTVIEVRPVTLRQEAQQPVAGLLVAALRAPPAGPAVANPSLS